MIGHGDGKICLAIITYLSRLDGGFRGAYSELGKAGGKYRNVSASGISNNSSEPYWSETGHRRLTRVLFSLAAATRVACGICHGMLEPKKIPILFS